ncbi:BRO family protein [Paenibacillus durus]|uniref:BRO family protein n=1 Tax=Paenibacillus durus TaxID=44251 RepID=UPI0006943B0B|nr:phage antirepressor KilAC domain-containing protein [Paenibacillus durus]
MEQLTKVFAYGAAEVRTVIIGGDPWFVAKDISDVLGFSETSAMTRYLDEDEKTNLSIKQGGSNLTTNITVISEPGLYSAILRSRKPEARAFKRWVTHEVIQSIRKTGMYAADELLDDPDLLLKTVTRLTEERRARLAAEAQVIEMTPKAEAFDTFIDADGTMTIDQVAKMLGIKPKGLRDTLRERKLIRQDGLPYQRFTPRYFEVVPYVSPSGTAKPYSRVTTEGVAYIERILAGACVEEPPAASNVIALPTRQLQSITLNLRQDA